MKYWQLWNEPNLTLFLRPQFVHNQLVSPAWYRQMTNAFYKAVHAAKANASEATLIADAQGLPSLGAAPDFVETQRWFNTPGRRRRIKSDPGFALGKVDLNP